MKIKNEGITKATFEKAYKELEKTNNQLMAMKKLNITLNNQLKELENNKEK
jgi:hypothetical protein